MKKITESELKDRVNRLKEYMAVVENDQYANEGAMNLISKYGGKAVDAVKGAGSAIGNALSTTGGKIAAGMGLGAAGLAAGQAMTKPGGAAAPTGATTGAKSDPAILKQQQDLIAKGAKIKADGIMGPATQAAMKQFGGQAAAPAAAPTGTTAPAAPAAAGQAPAPAGTTGQAPAAAQSTSSGAAAPAPAATPSATSTSSYAASAPPVGGTTDPVTGQYTVTDPSTGGSTTYVSQNNGTILSSSPSAKAPAATPAAAPAQAVPGVKAGGEVVDTRGGLQGQDEMEESVTFQNDELSRILTLIHHR